MNILTFDIEDWFHILDHDSTKTEKDWDNFEYRLEANLDKILEILISKKQKATFFCLGWVASKYPNVIRTIYENNFEIGSHSYSHQLVYEQNPNQFRNDLKQSIESIEDIIGVKCIIYRAPGFSIKEDNQWAFEELIDQGIKIDCSVFPAKRAHGGFRSFTEPGPCLLDIRGKHIKEFPMSVYNIKNYPFVFSGGGYFRLIPYKIIHHLLKKSNYVMTYFHPRDFDPNQPIISDLSIFRKFKSYVGLKSSFKKLEKLISDFEFIDLNEADNIINWNEASIVKF